MEKINIPETYEEFLKTPKKDILKISKMDIPLEVAVISPDGSIVEIRK